jgi:transposase
MKDCIKIYVALDVHKETIAIAAARANSRELPRFIGSTPNNLKEVIHAIESLGVSKDAIAIAYEAGPCGYDLQRKLCAKGYACAVIAPSRISRPPGERIKTDRRDAILLAKLLRSGDLSEVAVPDKTDEAMRDLTRLRTDAKNALRVTRQQLLAFLLRQGQAYRGKANWTKSHWGYLAKLQFEDPNQHIVFAEYKLAAQVAEERLKRIDDAVRQAAESWRWLPVVRALMGLRGVDFLIAVNIIAELGDLTRFEHPRHLMSYLGLVPSEYSSGPKRHRGEITKSGNKHIRSLLTESAWSYRHPAKVSPTIAMRMQPLPLEIGKLCWKAQVRLCHRHRKLTLRGLHSNKVCTAVARELAGFIWDIGQKVRPLPSSGPGNGSV